MKKRKKENDVPFEDIWATKEKALNYLFSTYYSDLCFIINFQKYRDKKIGGEYFDKVDFSFKEFLKKYSVLRGIDKAKHKKIFETVFKFISNELTVDGNCELKVKNLVECIKKITENNNVSMASKILFLSEPDKILPIDSNVKKASKTNNYNKYLVFVNNIKETNIQIIFNYLSDYFCFMEQMEKQAEEMIGYKITFSVVEMRINRFIDILLWRKGAK